MKTKKSLKRSSHAACFTVDLYILLGLINPADTTRAVDPDWIRIQLGLWIRIQNPDPNTGGQK